MSQLNLKIVTPEKEIFDSIIDQLYITTPDGEIGILPDHASLMTKIVPGELRIKKGSQITTMATGDGFLQIHNNVITLMTDLAIEDKDIDEKAAEEARKRAQSALDQKLSNEEYADTLAILEKSLAQLRVKRRHRAR
jgi:F-type H+-transporting ATPase subunit epsilon